MSSKKNRAVNYEYDVVAPDGGYGYVICAAIIIIFTVSAGFAPCFGLLYKDLIDDIGMGLTEISLCNGINAMSFAFCGFITNSLLQYMSKRQLAFIAMTIFNCGIGLLIFARSMIPFLLFFSMQGAGLGLLFNISFTILNEYFAKKTLFANSLVQTLTATGTMFLPQYVKLTYGYFGYRGSILMVTGMCLQGFVAVLLLQPVNWHKKRIPRKPTAEELHVLLGEDGVLTIKLNDIEKCNENTSVNKLEVTSSIDDLNKSSWIVKLLRRIFDFTSIKMMLKTNVSWSVAVTMCIDATFTLLLPQALYADNWDGESVALAITMATFGDLAGRLLIMTFSKWIKIGSQEMCILALVVASLSKIGYILFSTSKILALASIVLSGLARSIVILYLPVMTNEIVGPEKFSSAIGFNMIMIGSSVLGLGSLFGVIRDYTGSYAFTIGIMSAINALSAILWTIERVYKRLQMKKITT